MIRSLESEFTGASIKIFDGFQIANEAYSILTRIAYFHR